MQAIKVRGKCSPQDRPCEGNGEAGHVRDVKQNLPICSQLVVAVPVMIPDALHFMLLFWADFVFAHAQDRSTWALQKTPLQHSIQLLCNQREAEVTTTEVHANVVHTRIPPSDHSMPFVPLGICVQTRETPESG